MSKRGPSAQTRRDALDRLRADVEAARRAADAHAAELAGLSMEELERLCDGHPLGTNRSGWTNPYPETDPRNLYYEYQFRLHHDKSRFKASMQSRQTGKDFTSQGEIADDCLARPKTEWMVGGPSERQALDSLDQGKTWAEAFGLMIEDFQVERDSLHPQALLKSAEVVYQNGSRVRAVPGRPDTVRGRSANVLLTEFDFFEDPAATWRAILPSITNPLRGGEKKVRVVSTPNGKGRMLHKIFESQSKPGAAMAWSKHLVTIYHAVLMGLPVDIAALREALDDPLGFAQEFLCEFLDGSNVLLPYELIALAEHPEALETPDTGLYDLRGADLVGGLDFGRTTDPTVWWCLQRIGDTWWTREVLVLDGVPTNEQETILRPRVAACRRVAMDYTGPGIGLGDYLVAQHGKYDPAAHKFGRVELCTFTPALKREIFPRLRRAFEAPTRLRIPISIPVREDLHNMQQLVRAGGFSYDSPRTREGHSDRCVALALAWRCTDGAASLPPMTFPRRRKRFLIG